MNEERGMFARQMQIAEKLDFKDNICPMCGSKVDSVREPFYREAIGRHLAEHEIQHLEKGLKELREIRRLRTIT